jgi:hypothetical protein
MSEFKVGDRIKFEAEGEVTWVYEDDAPGLGVKLGELRLFVSDMGHITKIIPPRKTGTEQYRELPVGSKFEFVLDGRARDLTGTRIKVSDTWYARIPGAHLRPEMERFDAGYDQYDINPL